MIISISMYNHSWALYVKLLAGGFISVVINTLTLKIPHLEVQLPFKLLGFM